MADKSAIEWTDATWNPIRARSLATGKVGWHCEHVTPGCEHCYAEGFNRRLGTGLDFKPGHRKDIEIFLDEEMLTQPLRWKKPRRIFVGSMTDLFADFVEVEWLDKIFAVMALSPQHTYQVLTKRAGRMREYLSPGRESMQTRWLWAARDTLGCYATGGIPPQFPPANVWLGISAERQQEADERIPELLQTPAAVRFISAEPLLGPIDLRNVPNDLPGEVKDWPRIDWVIVGGESGREARAMHPDWARSLRDQCSAAGVCFFFKQWGEWAEWPDAEFTSEEAESLELQNRYEYFQRSSADPYVHMRRVGKAKAGRLLDGIEHNQLPISGGPHGV